MIVNLLALLGAILYIVFQVGGPFLHLTPVDLTLKNLAFSLLILIQIIRGLAFYLGAPLPSWLLLTKMDRRFGADSTVVFLFLFLIVEATMRSHLDRGTTLLDPRITWPIMALEAGLGIWLLVCSGKRNAAFKGVGWLPLVSLSAVFFLPLILAVGLVYGLAKYFDLRGQREIELLAVSGMTPILLAAVLLALKDTRNRLKNTAGVVVTQLAALPAIPIFYVLLKNFWPKNISVVLFPIGIMVILAVPRLLPRRAKPWLVKERVESLLWQISQSPELALKPTPDMEAELKSIRADMQVSKLTLKTAGDHFDRADALAKLGALHIELARYGEAESDLKEAVEAYNTVIGLEPEHRQAQANKFKAVENLSIAQRNLNKSLD